jgi:glutathione S-transferase
VAGQRSGPILIYNNEPPRAGWAEILLLSEGLAQDPSLLPKDAADRVLVFGLAHEICGEQGLAWARRLQLIHTELNKKGGFPERVSKYLAKKYGYSPQAGANAGNRVADLLHMLASRLKERRQAGSGYYIGDALTAVDIYSATCMAMFAPLPSEQCQMDGPTRAAFESRDAQIEAALDPILFEHRDRIYAERLELPLSL